MNLIDQVCEAMRAAAGELAQGNAFQQVWATHLLNDRRGLLLLALTWETNEINGRDK